MISIFLIITGNLIAYISRIFNFGNGSTWPGHIALFVNKNFIKEIIDANPHLKIILIAGTNGKTTTGKLIQTILENSNYRVFQNESGANLLNGIASSMLLRSSILCRIQYDYAIFEVDENTLSLILKEITPTYLILLNLFRDQLDRYGEVNTIALKWQQALEKLSSKTTLFLNADDPQIAYLGITSKYNFTFQSRTIYYFGLNDKRLEQRSYQHASDSAYCPNCNSKLYYNTIYFSHLGNWQCQKCNLSRPSLDISNNQYYPIPGVYNRYNVIAAVLCSQTIGVSNNVIKKAIRKFKPAFGRQETLDINGKKVQIFLSKNPTSFNESLRTITSMKAKNLLLVLNDRIPDGRDVSWIWDIDFEENIDSLKKIVISGDRAYDMGLRIKYAMQSQSSKRKAQNYSPRWGSRLADSPRLRLVEAGNLKFTVQKSLKYAIHESLKAVSGNETLYILPTYSSMLEVRKILTGRKL